jgi:hypothetical protein
MLPALANYSTQLNHQLPRYRRSYSLKPFPALPQHTGRTELLVVSVPLLVLPYRLLSSQIYAVHTLGSQPLCFCRVDHPLKLIGYAGPLEEGSSRVMSQSWPSWVKLGNGRAVEVLQYDLLAKSLLCVRTNGLDVMNQ